MELSALVVDSGRTEAGLAVVRDLGTAGWVLGVATPSGRGMSAASRYCARKHVIPEPGADEESFIECIKAFVEEHRYQIVFATSDSAALALSRYRDVVGCVVPYCSDSSMRTLFDKYEFYKCCLEDGIGTPHSELAVKGAPPRFTPVIVKERLHWKPQGKKAVARIEAGIAFDEAEAMRLADRFRDGGGEPIYQRYINGPLCSLQVLLDMQGNLICATQQHANYIWRPLVGRPTQTKTVPVDEDLLSRVLLLLKRKKWVGLLQLQFIEDEEGNPHVIDFNGRAYMSQALALKSGIRFHDLWARSALGLQIEPLGQAETGKTFQCFEHDFRRAISGSWTSLARNICGSLVYAVRAVHPIVSLHDPLPLLEYFRIKIANTSRRYTAPSN